MLWQIVGDLDSIGLDSIVSMKTKPDKELVIFTKTGGTSQPDQAASILISVYKEWNFWHCGKFNVSWRIRIMSNEMRII